jgi:predicted nucleic acid-binding protein
MLTVHLIMHFGRKEQIDDYFLQAVINENELFSLSAEDYEWALVNERGKDFEDALQLAVAMRTNCDTFLTLDKKLARDYADLPLKILVV